MQGGLIRWLATPSLGCLRLKLRKRTKLSLRRFCLGLFRYCSVRSPPSPSKILRWMVHNDCKMRGHTRLGNADSYELRFEIMKAIKAKLKCAEYPTRGLLFYHPVLISVHFLIILTTCLVIYCGSVLTTALKKEHHASVRLCITMPPKTGAQSHQS